MSRRFNFDPIRSVEQYERMKQDQSGRRFFFEPQQETGTPEKLAKRMKERIEARKKNENQFQSGMRSDGRYHYRGRRITKTTFNPW